jgi:glycosyltransferase involved in cell wall biosynthesis
VQRELPETQLVVAGDGSLKKNFNELRNVKMLGVVKHSEVARLFKKAWITVTPSIKTKDWAEQVGMVNIQSICCQTPVISTNSGSISEYMNDNFSVLVAEHSSEKLAKKIIDLLKDDKRRQRMGKRGLEYARENYDARKNILKVEKVLTGVFDD